jgi:threonine dehydratase
MAVNSTATSFCQHGDVSSAPPSGAATAAVPLVSLADVEAAREILDGVVRRTPLEGCRVLSASCGGPVFFKCENLQRAGSFKIRGAYVRIARMTDNERARGGVAASAGNHAQGVALAASLLGARATIVMPQSAPLPKIEATGAYGADVRLYGHSVDEALIEAERIAGDTGAILVHPFDHPDIIAGQGTVGLEILEQCPDVRTIVVSMGGGGLVSGIASAVKAKRPDVRIVGVQAAGAAAWPESLQEGHPVALTQMQTMADGIAVGRPGLITFAHVAQLVDEVVTVSDEALSRALLLCLERAKLVVEPAGVAAVAAIQEHPHSIETPAVAVLSGGNIDPLVLLSVIRHGLAAAKRYLSLQVRVPDLPGSLARLLEVLATTGANVLDVVHRRTNAELTLDEVDVQVQLETRGPAHVQEVLRVLAEAGYQVRAT